jgi:DNA modification methylase
MPVAGTKDTYSVQSAAEARDIAHGYVESLDLESVVEYGLPEVDDRYDVWRVPMVGRHSDSRLGEVVVDAETSLVDAPQSTGQDVLERRLLGRDQQKNESSAREDQEYTVSNIRNTVGLGDSEELIADMPASSVDLVFTSPPYYNAKPEASEYANYEEYLLKLKRVFEMLDRVLISGKFLVVNSSPVLIRRASRNDSSTRVPVPFDIHRILTEIGFEFVDDIVWKKPEGAGWATGRGRRFAADRNPMQYKPAPVTEYLLVYRSESSKLIDFYINEHPDRDAVEESKIEDGYEKTNVWEVQPDTSSDHPAPFPAGLAERVIRYYSFVGDVVLDPFAGTGTTGSTAHDLDRRFVMFEKNEKYVDMIREALADPMGTAANEVDWINTAPPSSVQTNVGEF